MISKSFLKSSFIYTAGGAMPMAASFVLLPFYSNLLDSQHFVALGFYISISLFLQILFSFSLETYFGVKYTQLAYDKEAQKTFSGTIAILAVIIGVIICLLSLAAGPFLFPLIFENKAGVQFDIYAVASIMTAFFNAFFKTATNSLIYFKDPGRFFWFNAVNFLATIVISLAGLFYYPNSLIGPISGRFFSGVIIFALGLLIFKVHSTFRLDRSYLKDIFIFCTPYMVYVLLVWLLNFSDRFFLLYHIDSDHLAAYDQLLKCYFGIEFFQNSLSAVIFPRVFEVWSKTGKHETTPESNRYFNVFTAINILLLILFCLCIPFFIKAFIPKPEYYHSFNYIGLIAAGYATRSILNFYLVSILYSKSIRTLLMIFGISAVINLAGNYFLVGQFGLLGAIFTMLASKLAAVFLSMILTRKTFTYHFNYFKIYGLPLLFVALNVVSFIFFPVFSYMIYFIQLLIFSGCFYFIFRNEISIVFNQFFKKQTV